MIPTTSRASIEFPINNILSIRFYLALAQGDADAAEAVIDELESLQPDAHSRHLSNIQIAVVRKQREAAVEGYRWLAERRPMTPRHWLLCDVIPPQGVRLLETASRWANETLDDE